MRATLEFSVPSSPLELSKVCQLLSTSNMMSWLRLGVSDSRKPTFCCVLSPKPLKLAMSPV
ncbi:hypothetical protein D3C87_1601570 [compost metagenome]